MLGFLCADSGVKVHTNYSLEPSESTQYFLTRNVKQFYIMF